MFEVDSDQYDPVRKIGISGEFAMIATPSTHARIWGTSEWQNALSLQV